jgi:hypothetical protein
MTITTSLSNERDSLVHALSGFPEVLTNEHIQQFTCWSINTINKYASDGKFPDPLPRLGRIKRYSKTVFIDFWLQKDQESTIKKPSNKRVGRPTIAEQIKNSR